MGISSGDVTDGDPVQATIGMLYGSSDRGNGSLHVERCAIFEESGISSSRSLRSMQLV